MTLTIDIGNSRAKACVFSGNDIVARATWADNDEAHLLRLCTDHPVSRCAYSNVGRERLQVAETLHRLGIPTLRVSGTTPSAVSNPFPTLGGDRLAALAGAVALWPDRPLLVIDTGTCVTYDLVSPDGHLEGGFISAGLQMRLNAMHEHTALLPLIGPQGPTPDLGHDTPTAMRSGTVLGLRFEAEGFIRHMARRYAGLHTVVTGGDSQALADAIGHDVSVEPDLTGIGLKHILEYQQNTIINE